ncbi:peptide chain release factor 3 (bRF-3) [Arcticibacter tournemirensis]|uniref:Peptide chain release factor 3 n=1 Tax=Arcticibacter tournemirensis TaxID=699437 RepID=A0A5M9H070_9SPHI|nr:peptide chain release factor 3 [Arcticibacter tournemirensis]KAA8479950.1 peptide chain release factor 3 [Arcticibacter tournemirensis]TQM51590.1 peptide chain release factor 3 (bRF-3) [Arcticibacter tournemirensis]
MSRHPEIEKRKTFAIISHPDAGKTTLTEKFLLFGGAINTAGAVKRNKANQNTTSDFMEIEKQRGISVATSVMGFEYKDKRINILDTPGHKDFAEDTYRTLSAVDSVILVVDSVKGVEEQTEKLMEVCRMRNTPVIIFINKMDREGKDAFDLLDELETKLTISVCPQSWPIGQGYTFKGVYNIYGNQLNLFEADKSKISEPVIQVKDLHDPLLSQYLQEKPLDKLKGDLELIEGIYGKLDKEMYLEGLLAPVFFGSAINNFGIRELLDTFIDIAPSPHHREAEQRMVYADEKDFTGFVFKIHANLDPKHRDRIAFLRICSGKFERNKFYYHTRQDKKLKFSNPMDFMANDKTLVEEAWPGDVVGLYDSGNFKIGDTLTEGEKLQFKGIPSFSPEIFKEVENRDPMKTKQLEKGIQQLTEEGVAQLFVQQPGNRKIIGAVGALQFEVINFRLENEYGAKCAFRPLSFSRSSWITASDKKKLQEIIQRRASHISYDKDGNPVFLADNDWAINLAKRDFPDIEFHTTSEFRRA